MFIIFSVQHNIWEEVNIVEWLNQVTWPIHYLTNSIALWEHLNNFFFSLKKKKNKTVGRRIEK